MTDPESTNDGANLGGTMPDSSMPDGATPDQALERDAARARALFERRDAFELSPEQLARGKQELDAALDEHDLRAAHDAAQRDSKKDERGRIRRWLYTPVLPVLAGLCALALAVRFSREDAPPARTEAAAVRALPTPTRELVLAQTARLEARLARLDGPLPSVGETVASSAAAKAKSAAPAGSVAAAPTTARSDARPERDFDRAMQAYRSQLLASLTEGP